MVLDIKSIVRYVEYLIPNKLLYIYRSQKETILWRSQKKQYEVLCHVSPNTPLNVIFLVLFPSVWKYDSVLNLMQKDVRFKTSVLVCPVVNKGKQFMIQNMEETYKFFRGKGYNVVPAYDKISDAYIDVNDLSPDIIFFSSPYLDQVDKRYNHISLKNYLKCYINYAYVSVPYAWAIASSFHKMMWLYFSECEANRSLVKSYDSAKFDNVYTTGYPIYDEYKNTTLNFRDWKIKNDNFKRVIWAPHHTIDGNTGLLQFSTFLIYYQFMLDLADKYHHKIQFVFKPHPLLKSALYLHSDWGKEKTDEYYEKWANGDNTSYVNGNYMTLFRSSDAMIHDCGSFIIEYLYTKKPVMFLTNYDRYSQSNDVGKDALNCHYQGNTEQDIINFLENVVLGGNDNLREARESFYDNILLPPNGLTVAENIINIISDKLNI